MGHFHRIIAITLVLAALGAGGMAHGGQDHPPAVSEDASQWHSTDHARVRLIRGGLTGDGRDLAGLVIEVDDGWHTYWRSPGNFGLPPTFNWDGSNNIRGVEVEWPAPQHIVEEMYEAYGYRDRVVLPLLVTREDQDQPARLNLAVGYAVCETICIPAVGYVSINLPAREAAGDAAPSYREAILDAEAEVPVHGLAAAGLEMDPPYLEQFTDGSFALQLAFTSRTAFNDPHVIVEGPKGTSFGASVILLRENRRRLQAAVPVDWDPNAPAPLGEAVIVTVIGGRVPVEFPLETAAAPGEEPPAGAP
jgi:suppressor for copper-sensitivity B